MTDSDRVPSDDPVDRTHTSDDGSDLTGPRPDEGGDLEAARGEAAPADTDPVPDDDVAPTGDEPGEAGEGAEADEAAEGAPRVVGSDEATEVDDAAVGRQVEEAEAESGDVEPGDGARAVEPGAGPDGETEASVAEGETSEVREGDATEVELESEDAEPDPDEADAESGIAGPDADGHEPDVTGSVTGTHGVEPGEVDGPEVATDAAEAESAVAEPEVIVDDEQSGDAEPDGDGPGEASGVAESQRDTDEVTPGDLDGGPAESEAATDDAEVDGDVGEADTGDAESVGPVDEDLADEPVLAEAPTLFDQDAVQHAVVVAPDGEADEDEDDRVAVAADAPTLFDQDDLDGRDDPDDRDGDDEDRDTEDRDLADLDDPVLQPQAELWSDAPQGAVVAAAPKVHIRYEPALDGLRGLAVIGVLLFHGQFAWARGGFLGVSTFFTLSGFLITTLLVTEHHGRSTISLRNFWTRRFRRLMPASLAALAGISVLFGLFVADPSQLNDLRGDVLSALLYVANWHFIFSDQSYTDLFTQPSPVQHFWSLAIEEQFYVVFPLLVFGVLRVARGSRAVLGAVLVTLTVGSVALMLHAYQPGLDTTRVYYSTFTRAAELLVGAILALALFGRGPLRRPGAVLAAGAVGVLALGATVWCWINIGLHDEWLYQGGLTVYALFSAGLIVAAVQVTGPVRSIFSRAAIVRLGKISYGVYLYHWPIFLWLTPERTGLALWPLFALRVAVTLFVAAMSYWYLEQPVRQRVLLVSKRSWLVAPAAVTTVAMAVILVTLNPPAVPNSDFAEATQAIDAPETSPEALAAQADAVEDAVPVAATTAPAVHRVLLVGDSVMGQAYPFFRDRFAERGITTGYAGGPGTGPLFPQGDGDWLSQIDRWVSDFDPDVVVIEACCDYTNPPDHLYELPDGTQVLPNTDLAYQTWEQVSREMIRRASAGGARVFWVISAPVHTNGYYGPMEDHVTRLNAMYERFPVPKIDWATPSTLNGEYSDDLPIGPNGEMVRVRADDGLHYTPEGDALLADTTLRAMLQLEARPGF